FNGLEAGMGFVLMSSVGIFALINDRTAAAYLSLIFAFSLLAFLRYNWYPARVFPGDLNHTIGALAACIAIIGNIEKYAILCFIPYILEAVLKSLSFFKSENFGLIQPDGTVKPKEKKIRSLTHIVMRLGSFKESQVTSILIAFETIICILAYFLIKFI
ncbi:UDP-N-acetylglucosamine--dolichyl-phosphate N-acetylglucosaminephosphotransferase, partial [Candidatus Bathyarchaeota archaeon]|nr:UDP-N-acetylglucosamine--dolichyl-phosphate N-acetylglucosaminephosphotransferase [Candidatus Bathyarchaeota archaeon]